MTYRVIQFATGRLGTQTVRGIAGHPDLELVGAWVHSEAKEGHDVGELCGLEPLGVRATRDKDALRTLPADCVCYTPARSWTANPMDTVDELAEILRTGKNVVNAAWPALVNPAGVSKAVHEQLQQACLEGGSTFYTSGIDPGYGSLGLAIAALNVTSEVRSVLMQEIGDLSTWDDSGVLFYGFGQSDIGKCLLLKPGATASIFSSTLTLIAQSMGGQLDDIVETHDVVYADEAFEVGAYNIPAGTIAGMRFQVKGLVDGEARVVLEHVAKLRDQDFPDLDFTGSGYRVTIEGEPCARLEFKTNTPEGDFVRAGYVACAMSLVNAIPQVCAAAPGILTYVDLKAHPSRNFPRRLGRAKG